MEAMDAMPTRVDTKLLFPGARGGYLNLRNFRNREWNPAVRAIGLEGQTIYSLRHSYASWSISAGESLFALARFMGTSVKMIDQTYGHLIQDAEEQNLSLLNSWDGRALGATGVHEAELRSSQGRYNPRPRAVSSVGRAPARQAGGHWFEPQYRPLVQPAGNGRLRYETSRRPLGPAPRIGDLLQH